MQKFRHSSSPSEGCRGDKGLINISKVFESLQFSLWHNGNLLSVDTERIPLRIPCSLWEWEIQFVLFLSPRLRYFRCSVMQGLKELSSHQRRFNGMQPQRLKAKIIQPFHSAAPHLHYKHRNARSRSKTCLVPTTFMRPAAFAHFWTYREMKDTSRDFLMWWENLPADSFHFSSWTPSSPQGTQYDKSRKVLRE